MYNLFPVFLQQLIQEKKIVLYQPFNVCWLVGVPSVLIWSPGG